MADAEAKTSQDARRAQRLLVAGILWYSALLVATAGLAVAATRARWMATVPLAIVWITKLGPLLYVLPARRRAGNRPLAVQVARWNRPLFWGLHLVLFVLCAGWVSLTASLGARHEASYSRDDYERARRELAGAVGDRARYNELGRAAMTSVFFGPPGEAKRLAEELLDIAGRVERNWNYGNAVHDGHVVLGLLALREGRVEDAKRELRLAGETPGSPQLDTFGPNMMLARDLLRRGERVAVLLYFALCRRFWESHAGTLDRWEEDVLQGREPDFGANLVH